MAGCIIMKLVSLPMSLAMYQASFWVTLVGEDGHICSVKRKNAQAAKRHFEREETVLYVYVIIY
jgi:hypothetical protein